jgi:hypothetical protein
VGHRYFQVFAKTHCQNVSLLSTIIILQYICQNTLHAENGKFEFLSREITGLPLSCDKNQNGFLRVRHRRTGTSPTSINDEPCINQRSPSGYCRPPSRLPPLFRFSPPVSPPPVSPMPILSMRCPCLMSPLTTGRRNARCRAAQEESGPFTGGPGLKT